MKLIIDIPEEVYKNIQSKSAEIQIEGYTVENAVLNGTPILDDATNGDVIKAMFPNTVVDDYDYGKDPVIDVYGIDNTEYITLRKAWWNASYQKGGKE